MEHASPISAWENFYVIVGSSAGALTGLQFVVITLIASNREPRAGSPEVRAFGTPTVVHFCAALLVSAILTAPWTRLTSAAVALAVCGIAGVVYGCIVARRARGEMSYKPVLEDWIWHAVLPLLGYASVLGAAVALPAHPKPSLFVVGAAVVLFLFIGIHNAWDTVTYIAVDSAARHNEPK